MAAEYVVRILGNQVQALDFYQITKSISVGVSLLIVTFFQWVLPLSSYTGIPRKIRGKNMFNNLALAVSNSVLISYVCGSCLFVVTKAADTQRIGLAHDWPFWTQLLLSVIALDLTAYFWHRANHQFSFFWNFHRVHHCDEIYDETTAFRFHFGEVAISLLVRFLVVFLLGLPWQGILLFEVLYGYFNVFEHGSLVLPARFEKRLQVLFITPGLHRKHHSLRKEDYNHNFGTIFSFWDRLGKTFKAGLSTEEYSLGLPKESLGESIDRQKILGFWDLLVMPFRRSLF